MYIIKYPEKGRFSPEGIVTKWDKNVGDAVKKGDLLVQIETSGECIQMESATDGELLKVLADTGRLVRSGDPLAVVGKTGEDISRATKQLEQKKASPENRAPKYQTKPKAKPPISVKTVQPAQSKKEEVMTTPKSTGSSDNVIPILMPQAGQSMEEGTILSWKVKEGDVIEVGQVIMEIETDKATMEVEADAAGRVARIVSAEGDIVEVKKPVAFIANNDADVDAFLVAEGRTAAPAAQSAPTPASAPAADAGPEGVVIPILMPQAGQSMEEGTILSWKINEGDTIEVGQVIMEIETDKATMEVEAVDAGRIAKIVAAEGDIVEVKAPVAYLAEEGVDVDAYIASGGIATTPAPKIASKPAGAKTAAPAVQKAPASVSASGRVKASPAARKAAADEGIDLASMGAGSGPGGRILSSDVDNADVITTKTQVHTLSKMRRARLATTCCIPSRISRISMPKSPLTQACYLQPTARPKSSLSAASTTS
ncbi:MAG: biotin/lipoyl-containing protein [Planctomycetota bacterium]|jgi:pyruvate/2-oxoglutarate dehydrogenase complex dihydrolipoamide acyltransferase (E2) component